MGDRPIDPWEVVTMLTSLEYRGNEAAGVALMKRSGEVLVLKAQGPAWKFTHNEKEHHFNEFIEGALGNERDPVEIALVHTRKATCGSPYRNDNNHPLFNGRAAIVHNGVIRNHDALFAELKLERAAETDSDIIRGILDSSGITKRAIKNLNKIVGTVAAACVHPEFPGKFLLLRSGNPLVLAATKHKLYFASDKRTLYRVSKPFVIRHGIQMQVPHSDIAFVNVYNDSAWMFGPKGFEFHEEFKLNGSEWGGNLTYQCYNGDFLSRAERWRNLDEEEKRRKALGDAPRTLPARGTSTEINPALVFCPNDACVNTDGKRTLISLSADMRGMDMWRLRCKKCRTSLADAKSSPKVN